MDLTSILKGSSDKKVRYAIVGLGDISQEAMLPAIGHTGNSELTAFVTGDPEKAAALGERYNVKDCYSYDQFQQMISSGKVDAIYLATPNWLHAEFAVPALKAGIHVLLEKPMEVSTAKCREILDAQAESGAKLMVAYRLHFEPATLSTIDMIRKGELGELRFFSSSFSQLVNPENHRAHNGIEAGPLWDMGPYPVNAARYIFGDEPTEVISAVATRSADMGLDLDDTFAVTLRFPGDRLAQFTVSYAASSIGYFTVVGKKGSIRLDPSYTYNESLEQHVNIGGKKHHYSHKATDQFGGEMRYFSDCILNGINPEPDGEEGYADVRVLEGIQRALSNGGSYKLEPFTRTRRIDTDAQEQRLSKRNPPPTVNATSPGVS